MESLMNRKSGILIFLILVALAGALAATRILSSQDDWFVEHPMPSIETDRFFDIGIVDANGDDRLDIYTSNHHFRQSLLIADEKGGYHDVLSDWGLDQSSEFPLAELSFTAPTVDKSGIYIYWIGTQFVIRTHKLSELDKWSGSMRVNDPVDILKNEGFSIEKKDQTSAAAETVIKFSPNSDGFLRMRPGGQGLPITFQFSDSISTKQIYVGRGKISPRTNPFSLAMKDRHALAWADYNGDGFIDIFINRGALSGTLRLHSEEIRRRSEDELLVSRDKGKFNDIAYEIGIEKKGCSGRHASWLDFNRDDLLDLFVNCYDREHVEGTYSKQLYRQDANGLLHDVAQQVGLGLPDQQIGSFAWFDVDDDGDVDLLAFQDEGFFLYRNQDGRFAQEVILRRSFAGIEKIGYSEVNQYDGKISLADYDADGDIDAFSASKRGNMLLVNQDGKFSPVNPVLVGLPVSSITANWVDYDNDGRPDLHFVPYGLFQQQKGHEFKRTKLLEFHPEQYHAAVCNWFDLDNDGRLDVLMALNDNSSFKHWWQLSKEQKLPTRFDPLTFRNVGPAAHWLHIKLVGGKRNRQAIGAQVTVVTSDGAQKQEVGSSEGSFFSQGHYRLYFGLGSHSQVDLITVRWPDGIVTEYKNIDANRLLTVQRDAGT